MIQVPIKNLFFSIIICSALWLMTSINLPAQAQSAPNIVIPLGQVVTFNVPDGIVTFALGNNKIASVAVPSNQDRYAVVTAKAEGVTNVLIWTRRGGTIPINYVIEVSPNLRNEQIAIRVKVLEVSQGSDGKFGVNWSDLVTFKEAPPDAPFRFGLPTRPTTIQATVDTLINDRKARLLAQPTIVALNNQKASFLSGGQVPIVISERDRVNIQWKEFGVRLTATAKIEGTNTIQMKLQPEVSDVDPANSAVVANSQGGSFIVPAFKTRKVDSTLRVQNKDSIVIAGLLSNTKTEVIEKFPLLGDIPGLGWLFKSATIKENRTELVFIVTPTIIKNPAITPEFNYGKSADVENKK